MAEDLSRTAPKSVSPTHTSSNNVSTPSPSRSQSASASNVIRYRPYSQRYKRKRVQKALNTQMGPQIESLTEPISQEVSSDDNFSDTDDFHSCADFDDFGETSRISDFSPDSTDSEDAGSDEGDFMIRNVLYQDINRVEEYVDSDDDENCNRVHHTFRQLFSRWVIFWGICQNAVDDLLSIFRSQPWGIDLPKTCRALLKSPRSVQIKDVAPGKYHHFGILRGIKNSLDSISEVNIPSEIRIFVNVDGLPIAKSSGSQFWPILGMISNVNSRTVFCIGLYHGSEKPYCSSSYLSDFIEEALDLCNSGFMYKGRQHSLKIDGFICDAPARSFILCVKSHSGYFACTKCIQQGEYLGRVVFLEHNSPARTDRSFRNREFDEHHTGDSILTRLNIDMVKDIPIDPMHLVKLGVSRKLLLTWIRGPLDRRLPKSQVSLVSSRLEFLRDHIPKEYPRKTRSLKFVDRMKATEHGLFHSCVGPVVLLDILPPRLYHNFLVFHVAISILSSEEFCHAQNEYARELLHFFVREAEEIYGSEFLSFNVHCLIHLPDDVLHFGSLPNFSAFPFENYMQTLKKLLRKSDKPLQQIVKRLVELENLSITKDKREFSLSIRVFRGEHENGPLSAGLSFRCVIKQYNELRIGPFHLSCKIPDSCVYLHDMTVICLENIVKTEDRGSFFIGRRFRQKSDLYTYPIRSSCYNIFTHKFAIVEELAQGDDGDADMWVEVVCTSWFDGQHCLFPPKSKEKLITSFVKTCYPPESNWVKYPSKLIKTFATYKEARKRIGKAVTGDDLCTTDAETTKKSRKSRMAKKQSEDNEMSKKRKRIRQYEQSASSSSEDEMQITPTPPKPPLIALANSSLSPSRSNERKHSFPSNKKSTRVDEDHGRDSTAKSGLQSQKKKREVVCGRDEEVDTRSPSSPIIRRRVTPLNEDEGSTSSRVLVPYKGKTSNLFNRPVNYGYSVPSISDDDIEDCPPLESETNSRKRNDNSCFDSKVQSSKGKALLPSNSKKPRIDETQNVYPKNSTRHSVSPNRNNFTLDRVATSSSSGRESLFNDFRETNRDSHHRTVHLRNDDARRNLELLHRREIISANYEINDNQKLASGVFERLDKMELALQKKIQEDDTEGFNCDSFPLTSMLEFDEVNEQLKQAHNRKSLNEKLRAIGGKSPGSVVRKILEKIIDKQFGKQLSWYGKKGNVNLGSTLLGKTILDAAVACKKYPISESDAIEAAMAWLRHLKDKKKN